MKIVLPEFSLVVMVGPSGSGKTTFGRKHFKPTEVISSDTCRGLVSDDENDQAATPQAFELLHFIASRRLMARKLTVVDATNVQPEARRPLVALAREHHALPVAIVFKVAEALCIERNRGRKDREFGAHVIRQQHRQMRQSVRRLADEGFRHVFVLDTPEEIDAASIERQPLWCDLRNERGPFDIIGDIHGCSDELQELLGRLGYGSDRHPLGRKAVFLGDLVDRGPGVVEVLRRVMSMVSSGQALCVIGNHENKLLRWLKGRKVQITHGLAQTIAQFEKEPPEWRKEVAGFLDERVSHYVLDGGKLVVAHAGLKENLQGRASGSVREFAMYGETTGETDEFGPPIRLNWALEYRGRASVVYGHTPVREPEWLNNTINIDTGCVFGGRLTALRYPEREIVSVPARRAYYEPARPFLPDAERAPVLTEQQKQDDVLDVEDVLGKRVISTRLVHAVTIREENAAAALEVMSRFAVQPKWLIYLPPTMAPSETSGRPDLLEHPDEAFGYFLHQGVPRVACEEKHMGSRAVTILCRDEETARRRFGVVGEGIGVCYTRTGRRFFTEPAIEREFLARLAAAFPWEELRTDWAALDGELLPWSAKAQQLIRQQYAAVGAACRASLPEAVGALRQAGPAARELLERYERKHSAAQEYARAYRRYCWPVNSLADLKFAPFHLLASEGRVHADRDHEWHMKTLAGICRTDPALLLPTPYRVVDVTDPAGREAGARWWEEMTARGGEGMVVKPLEFIASGRKGLIQPALKCRGREYLRIIYGPEYTHPENLERLKSRGLSAKRSLAAREFALGIEGLERFARREPLRRVHECVFGVLALESEPVDPRL
jgi:protein phosphatase